MIGILIPLNKISDTGILFYPVIVAIILAGIIMSARLKLNVHTVQQVLVGGILGFGTSFLAMHFLFRY